MHHSGAIAPRESEVMLQKALRAKRSNPELNARLWIASSLRSSQ
jgi:hypothetical protein